MIIMEIIKLKCRCGTEIPVSSRIKAVRCPKCGEKVSKGE